jgi:hypothetical protein
MRQLVDRYGQNPLLKEWAIAGPMTVYAEPAIINVMNVGDPAENVFIQSNRDKLMAAGYTLEAHMAAYTRAIESHIGLLGSSTMAFNPMQYLNPDGTPVASVAKSLEHIEEIAAILGPDGGAGNNSIRHMIPGWNALTDTYPTALDAIYTRLSEIAELTPRRPTYWQTATSARIGNLYEVCRSVVRMGGHMVELPDGVSKYCDSTQPWGMTPAQFDEINAGLQANAQKGTQP